MPAKPWPNNLDPRYTDSNNDAKLSHLIAPGLTTVDTPTLEPRLLLAEAIEARDERTVDVRLRPGLRFSDGSPLTSADVVYTFRRFLDPKFVSGRKGAYRSLKSVDILDDTRVAFRLAEPSASFPVNLVMGIVPEGTGAEAARTPIGTGPYKLASFIADESTTLTADQT